MSISAYKRLAIALTILGISGIVWFHYFRYVGFALLSEARKNSIVWHLDDRHQWGLPEQKPICRDLLEHQGYSSVNRSYWTAMAIDLAEKQGWTDLNPLVVRIYEQPKDIWAYQRAFLYLRAQAGKQVSKNLIAGFEMLRAAGYYRSNVSDEQVSAVKAQLLKEPDKEAVMIYAISLAGSEINKGGNERGRQAAGDILKNLDHDAVGQRIRQLQKSEQDGPQYLQFGEVKWIANYIGISLENLSK